MDSISIPSILLVSFPEAIIIAVLGILSIGKFSFFRNRDGFLKILLFACLYSVLTYFIRRNVDNEIERLIVYTFLICFLYMFLVRFKFYESVIATLIGTAVFIITETICISLTLLVAHMDLNAANAVDSTRLLITIPERIVQIGLIFISFRKSVKIVDFESVNIHKKEYYIQLFVYMLSISTLIFLAIVIGRVLLFDSISSDSNTILLRINIYLSLFVTSVLTLAVRNTHEFYKNKNYLNQNEYLQNLEYISKLIEEENYEEVKNAVNSLKAHITQPK